MSGRTMRIRAAGGANCTPLRVGCRRRDCRQTIAELARSIAMRRRGVVIFGAVHTPLEIEQLPWIRTAYGVAGGDSRAATDLAGKLAAGSPLSSRMIAFTGRNMRWKSRCR